MTDLHQLCAITGCLRNNSWKWPTEDRQDPGDLLQNGDDLPVGTPTLLKDVSRNSYIVLLLLFESNFRGMFYYIPVVDIISLQFLWRMCSISKLYYIYFHKCSIFPSVVIPTHLYYFPNSKFPIAVTIHILRARSLQKYFVIILFVLYFLSKLPAYPTHYAIRKHVPQLPLDFRPLSFICAV